MRDVGASIRRSGTSAGGAVVALRGVSLVGVAPILLLIAAGVVVSDSNIKGLFIQPLLAVELVKDVWGTPNLACGWVVRPILV